MSPAVLALVEYAEATAKGAGVEPEVRLALWERCQAVRSEDPLAVAHQAAVARVRSREGRA